jgi:hypothetical protein|tara:strand:- start:78 stop:326 length:249 start_codon:yes stop_codon:yes gene_type:complete
MRYKGTYVLESEHYALEIYYEYYYDPGSWEESLSGAFESPHEEVEVYKATYNGVDFTKFFWDFVEDSIYDQLLEYAQNNFPQ